MSLTQFFTVKYELGEIEIFVNFELKVQLKLKFVYVSHYVDL